MKHLKKQLALFLAVCMLLSMLPLQVFAAEDTSGITTAVTSQLEEDPLQEDALEEDVPTDEEDVPSDEGNEPTDEGNEPTDEGNEPTDEGNEPTDVGNEPTEEGNEPTEAVDETTGEENLVAMAEATTEELLTDRSITVIAGSDFQNPTGNDAGAQVVTSILTQMQNAGYTVADGFLFCGDYSYGYNQAAAGITALKSAVKGTYGTLSEDRMVFVQGNHDEANATGLAKSGAKDTDEYGVYVINEDDYMWRNDNVATIQNTANALDAYLDAKATEGYGKPIFVVSHLPLHYSMRTKNDGDGMYANYIFDVLNEAGASGLNIIFLYGHDHSNGWDDYLGGSAVYLAKGDKINIAQASQTEFKAETLNFTYLNAGFTGYYENHNGADDTLTMTVFSIEGNTVTVERYDANGKHNLKSAGVTNSYKYESGYAPNTRVYESPQTIALGTVTPPATVSDGNVSVTAPGLTGLTVTKKTVSFDTSVYSAYASYDITAEGYTQGDKATVTITLDESDGFNASRKVTVIDQTNQSTETASIVNGEVTFTTNHFSTYDIAQELEVVEEPTERTYTRVTNLDELVSGGQYLLIVNEGTDYFMLPESVSKESGTRVGFNIESTTVAGGNTITGDYSAKEWKLTASGSEWILSAASGDAYFANADGTRAQAVFSTTNSTKFTIAGSADNFTFKSGNYAFDHSSAGVINGYNKTPSTMFYIYRLTSGGSIETSGGNWVTISENGSKTIFRLANSLTPGNKYLIVSSNEAGRASAVNLDGTSINSASVTITADTAGNYIEAPDDTAQWTYTNSKFQNVNSTSTYLRGSKDKGLRTTTDTSDSYITWNFDDQNGLYTTKDSNNYYISSSFTMLKNGSSSNRVYIYKEDTLQTTAEYAKLTGGLVYRVLPGTSEEDALAAVKAGIDVVTSPDKTSEESLSDDKVTWTLDPSYNGTAGEYAVTISYKNQVLGTAKVVVPKLTVKSIAVAPMEGTVQRGAPNYTKTGSKLTVTYSDGSTETVDVTLGMLSGNFDKNTVGDYPGLTVTYGDKTVGGYTLHVTPKTGNNYPEYPHEGAVRVGKTAEGVDFQSSGIAKVELSATGVPVKKGADVIIMVDTSSSMNTTVDGSNQQRIEVLRDSLTNLMRQFQTVGADGEAMDIRVAIADFNGYVTSGEDNTPYRLKSVDHLSGTTTRSGENKAQVYTGSGLNADAFVTANQAASVIDRITTSSGTNYDYAFDAVYQLGEEIQTQNARSGEERDLFVIFMSDGAPFQYNYFSSQSDAANWNNWLQGTVTEDMWDNRTHDYFYNGSGNKHRMAEAIKGDPDAWYTVIRKDSTDNYGEQQYMTQVSGLGATMYSIGFCLAVDNQITVASMEHVLKNISSDPSKFYYSVNTADELGSAFNAIGNEIAYAATNARFVDTMGANYDLQMKHSTYTLSDGTTTDTIEPEIIVQAYDIYTKADGVAESEIGKRKGTFTVLETVTFKEDGTEAYSDKKSGNILIDGVICANTFWYNTTGNTISIDTDGNGTNDYNLAPETFYWKMGTINQTELALSYYVYLTGSMEGTREAGSYPTNQSATLHYTNWLGNEAKKDTVSPVLAWKSANVSYAFYLVNEDGQIIVNKSTGTTGSFANKVAVTNPVVYSEVLLNSAENVQADIVANRVLPEGYTLYDASAAYKVQINSNSTGSWTITKGKDPATTYVTEYGGDPTTELVANENNYDYTHTVVWFAVTYTVKAIPDAVVIDYGLPVDIHVLKNDLFYDKGELQYVGAEKTNGAVNGDANAAFTSTEFTGTYGKAEVIANTSVAEESVVRYTPANMQMNGVDKFSYAVNYTGSENRGYYYGTVTVIPATTIYYEDSFVTFTDATNRPEGNTTGVWTVDGTEQEGAVQDEDRPGSSSLSEIDANNLYGYDSHYTGFTTFSLGSARKVTVDRTTGSSTNAPEARFTFTGTGFDIISLTNNDSGTITVRVKDSDGKDVKKLVVDNYYGYTYDEQNGWTVDKNSKDTIWQVPVIKVEDLTYGTYNVTIQTAYMTAMDHQGDGSYTFWLDAIRVYNPAKGNETADDAHKQDKEYAPQYMTLRDLLVEGQKALDVEEPIEGAVFIDGMDSTSSIKDYANPGPNHETYLAHGQGVSFKLSAVKKPDVVQLGVKLAYGNKATLKCGDKDFQTLTTASDLYYKLDGLNWTENKVTGKYETGVITLSNSTEGAVISITNLKFTTDGSGTAGSETGVQSFVDSETVEKGPMLMRAMYCPVEEEVFFEPAYFSAVWKAGRVNKWSVLTVVTSEDVDSISVNGQEITKFVRIPEVTFKNMKLQVTYKRVWTYKEKINTAGSYTYDVTAYSADGTASQPVETVLTVSKR